MRLRNFELVTFIMHLGNCSCLSESKTIVYSILVPVLEVCNKKNVSIFLLLTMFNNICYFSIIICVIFNCFISCARIKSIESDSDEKGRIFWDAVSDAIEASNWLPIEVNIPDTIMSAVQGVGSVWSNLMGYFTSPTSDVPRIWNNIERTILTAIC